LADIETIPAASQVDRTATSSGAVAVAVAPRDAATRAGRTEGTDRTDRTDPSTERGLLRRVLSISSTVFKRTVAIAAFLVLWEVAPRVGLVNRTFLIPFSEAVRSIVELAKDGQLWDNTRVSLTRALSGFAIAILVAVPLGLLIGWYRRLAEILNPLLEVFRNTAVLAILPVFTLLLGIGETSKVTIVVYACVWPILLNTVSAVRAVDPTLVKSARSLSVSPVRLFQKVILPASVPTVFTGIRMAGSASILVLIAAEMVGAKDGLGFLINSSQQNFDIPAMYAGIITISVIGLAFNQLLVAVERRFTRLRLPLGG
jgi:NitT/TauT family transport system permease protein